MPILPDFITSAEWPPFSPDLNPIDYSIWYILEAMSCAKPHKTLEALKQSLIAAVVGPIVGGRIAAHGLEFSEAFNAVY